MKTVIHMMYKSFDIDVDTELDTPEQIAAQVDLFIIAGFKPRPKFEKQGAGKDDVVGKFGTIMFIDEGKTKGDKPCFFLRVKLDGTPEQSKNEMVEIMQMPIAKGKKMVCLWDLGTRVQIIKNERGYMDVDDASNTEEGVTEEEKKS